MTRLNNFLCCQSCCDEMYVTALLFDTATARPEQNDSNQVIYDKVIWKIKVLKLLYKIQSASWRSITFPGRWYPLMSHQTIWTLTPYLITSSQNRVETKVQTMQSTYALLEEPIYTSRHQLCIQSYKSDNCLFLIWRRLNLDSKRRRKGQPQSIGLYWKHILFTWNILNMSSWKTTRGRKKTVVEIKYLIHTI